MSVIYAYIGVVWGVNVGIYGSLMECMGLDINPAVLVSQIGSWRSLASDASGDELRGDINWIKTTGINQHPDWYPGKSWKMQSFNRRKWPWK